MVRFSLVMPHNGDVQTTCLALPSRPLSPACEFQRTAVCKKTLNPTWGEEFKFEVADDSVLQNEPIEFKVHQRS